MRSGGALLLALLCCVTACAPDAPVTDAELAIRLIAGRVEADLGRAFPLTVVRTWSVALEPDPWMDAALRPLSVRLIDVTRRESGGRVVESRRYDAYAFEPGEIRVAPIEIRAGPKSGGPARLARTEGFSVRVRTVLDPKAPGPPELLDPLPPGPPLSWAWGAGAAAAIVALAIFARRRVVLRTATRAAAGNASPRDRALARLQALRGRAPESRDDVQAWYVDATDAIREYVAARFGIPALEKTTEEMPALMAAAIPAEEVTRLDGLLRASDRVKFGRQASEPSARGHVLDAAEGFITVTANPPAGPGGPGADSPRRHGGHEAGFERTPDGGGPEERP